MSATIFGPEQFQAATNVSRETLEPLKAYAELLLSWQAKLNLISTSSALELWHRHFLDSAQFVDLAPSEARRWADLGSGAGFPGLVVAILKRDAPGFEMHLTERIARKCDFLREVIRATGAPAVVHFGRLETIPPLRAEVVSARACAPLPKLLEYFQRHKAPNGIGLFAKGRTLTEELTRAEADWTLDFERHPSRTGSGGQILLIRSAKHRHHG
jgi:16S rRNA (guanine527-N7)-methyltransferase